MYKDERDLLEVLKHELELLENGWYRNSSVSGGGWRPSFIFEDSPTCANYDCKERARPCADCVLMQLVPTERRSEKFPCRHIRLDASGQTLDSLYRQCDQQEIEGTVGKWLRGAITRLEEKRNTGRDHEHASSSSPGEANPGIPLSQKLHPKCANPACPTAFHWLEGGKFLRFRPDDSSPAAGGVQHFWLCEHCSHVLTLLHDEEHGIVLKLLWQELPIATAAGRGL
jgi:hypothetical protein